MTSNPYGLRVATEADAAALLDFVLPIFRDDAAQPVSEAKVAAIVARCIDRDAALAGIITGPQGIEASVGATIDQFDYTDQDHCMIRWLGVAPQFRKSDRATRMVGYVRWLHESMGRTSDVPVPVFLSALTVSEQRGKVLLYQRKAPMVGVLHAFGCLPERSFLTPGRAGKGFNGTRDSRRSDPVARDAVPAFAGTG